MSFMFGFGNDDQSQEPISYKDFMNTETPIGDVQNAPTLHSISSLLTPGANITYASGQENIPRRELFDVRHEIMQKDSLTSTEEILLGLTNEDIRINTYEGGLKVWECSFDLVKVLSDNESLKGYFTNCIELGCGAALPSAYLLQRVIADPSITDVSLTLADYNASVLKLVTAPNMLLAWKTAKDAEPVYNGEVELTKELLQEFEEDLAARNISLRFISGAWSPQFVRLIGQASFDLVLASETIYSLDTLPVFTDTVLNCLSGPGAQSRALVAAKKIYFGVGGGIPDYTTELERRQVECKTVFEKADGVGREVLQVSL